MIDPANKGPQVNRNNNDFDQDDSIWEFMDQELDKPYAKNEESTNYMGCLECCGNCQRNLQCICVSCGKGPLMTVQQGQVGLRVRFGKYVSKLKPGLYTYNPCSEKILIVETRAQVLDVGQQTLLTKDNVTVYVDAYVNYRIVVPENAMFKVVNYHQMIRYFTQGVMKTIVAEHTLSEMLTSRKKIERKLTEIIDEKTDPYGLKVFTIETQKIELPVAMERAMATVAETEKQSEARLIDAKGNLESAKIFKEAADELSKNEISLQLQYFETLKYIAAEKNKTIIVPDSILSALRSKPTGK
jgi:regulator of protease activity HflC (stomatin/prohibitin superfamily)